MDYYYELDEDNYIINTTEIAFHQDDKSIFSFPENFNFLNQEFYQIINNELVHDKKKEDCLKDQAALNDELNSLYEWFDWYDVQIAQYNRDIRFNGVSDINVQELDGQAVINQQRIRELREVANEQ